MAQQSGQVRFVRKGGRVYHPAEWGPTFNRPRRSCFQEQLQLSSGSEAGKSSFNTSLKYIKVGFGGAQVPTTPYRPPRKSMI